MEPITHFLTGACIGRAGFNRQTAYATLAAVLAAEAADLDILWGFAGPVEQLKHHRGITHTLIGAPVVAAVVAGAVWLLHIWREEPRPSILSSRFFAPLRTWGAPFFSSAAADEKSGRAQISTSLSQPFHLGWLYLTALVAAFSHILLDWTNNYGVRPFFPFNPRWYQASIIFIFEPVIWALLLLALIMPGILGLTDREIGVRRQPFPGRGWAIFALSGMVLLWSWRGLEQAKAIALIARTQVASEPVVRLALEPYPINPYRWHVLLETRDFYQTVEINTWNPDSPAAIQSDSQRDVLYKPLDTPAVEAAKRTLIGRVYQDWGSWLVMRDAGQEPVAGIDPPQLPPNRQWTTVVFSDLRFGYSLLASQSSRRTPLSGWVYIVDGHEEAAEGIGGKEQPSRP